MDDAFPVVIIGGGLAGLTAAVHLAERGIRPLILETNTTWPGGRLAGGEPDTFTYLGQQWSFDPDHGMHALWGGYVNMRETVKRFTDITLVESDGEEWINRWGRNVRAIEAGNTIRNSWIPAPFHYLQLLFRPQFWRSIIPLDFLSLPGLLFSMGFATAFDPIKEQSRLEGLSMEDFFTGWTPNLRATFRGLGVNLLAAPAEAISLTGFIAAMRFYTILRRDAWQMQYFPQPPARSYIPRLIEHIRTAGGDLYSGLRALTLTPHNVGWRIIAEDAPKGGKRSLYAQNIIIATDAPGAKRLLHAGDATRPQAEALHFPSALRNAVIRLWFSRSPREGTAGGMFTGDFVLDNFFWLHRLYAPFKTWHTQTGGSAVEVHMYGSENLMDQEDRHLLILAVNDVQYAFPELKGTFVHGVVRRNSRTQTDFRIPQDDTLGVHTPWQNVYACGDWVAHPTPAFWMERATTTGIEASNAILHQNNKETYPVHMPNLPEHSARLYGLFAQAMRYLATPIAILLKKIKQKR